MRTALSLRVQYVPMWTKSLSIPPLLCVLFVTTGLCAAQKVPIILEAPAYVNKDETALRFSKSLSDEIQLSGRFYLWSGSSALPPGGLRITVRSVPVTPNHTQELGSALFVVASQPSTKEQGYFKEVSEQMMWIPKGAPVGDETRSFLASVAKALER